MTLIGYHGTTKSAYNGIKIRGFQHCRTGWFGVGAYFYKDNEVLAINWACSKHLSSPKVSIKVKVSVDDTKVFDLRNPRSNDSVFFHEFRKKIIKKIEQGNLKYNFGDEKKFDNLIIEMIKKEEAKEVIIANSFTYDGSFLSRIPNGTEICVSNNRLIRIIEYKDI